jgi:hypothetical protein
MIYLSFYMYRNNQHQRIRFSITNTEPWKWTWSRALSISISIYLTFCKFTVHITYRTCHSIHLLSSKHTNTRKRLYVTVCSIVPLLLITCINNKVRCAVSGDRCTDTKNTTGTHAHSTLPVVEFLHVLQSSQWVLGALTLGIKWLRSEAGNSPTTSAQVKKKLVYTSIPPYIFF